jgi:hypothetical protein
MRDLRFGKKGFFTLSKIKNWLTKLLIDLNPPVTKMALVPVRIRERDNLKRNI